MVVAHTKSVPVPAGLPDQFRLIAIDPGDKHVGVTSVIVNGTSMRWDWATLTPEQMIARMEREWYHQVIIESYELYPWLMHKQGFSSLHTPQLIGVLKYICAKRGMPVKMQKPSQKAEGFRALSRLGVLVRHSQQHPKDAAAHAALGIEREIKV